MLAIQTTGVCMSNPATWFHLFGGTHERGYETRYVNVCSVRMCRYVSVRGCMCEDMCVWV